MTTTGTSATPPDLLTKAASVLARVGTRWRSFPVAGQVALLALLVIVKAGVGAERENIEAAYLPAAGSLPEPIGYYSASLGNLLLARLLGVDTLNGWIGLHVVLLLAGLTVLWLLLRRRERFEASWLALVLTTSAGAAALSLTVGKYDPFTFVGAVGVMLAGSVPLAAGFAAIMTLGNPEQAVVAAIVLLVLTLVPDFRSWRPRGLLLLAVSVAGFALIQAWLLVEGVRGNRIAVISKWLDVSVERRLTEGLPGVWSWLGLGWLIVIAVLIAVPGRQRWFALAALVGIPAVVTLITVDGSRVFALCVLPALLAAALYVSDRLSDSHRAAVLGASLLAVVIVPF